MHLISQIAQALSAVAFLLYGLSCLFSDGMAAEFARFGLSRFRRLTGALEVLGALGLLVGYLVPALVVVAAGGLTLLMALGVLTRLRIGDPLVSAIPALILLAFNLFICIHSIGLIAPSP